MRSCSTAMALRTAVPQRGPQWISRVTLLVDPSANRRESLTFPTCSRIDQPRPCSSLIWSRRARTQGSVSPGLTRGIAPADKEAGGQPQAARSAKPSAKKRKTDASRGIHMVGSFPEIPCTAGSLQGAERGLRGRHLLHGMQGVSGSSPLGSIPSDSLRCKGSFLLLRPPAEPRSGPIAQNPAQN